MNEILTLIPKYGYYKDLCRLFDEAQKEKLNDLKKIIIKFYIERLKEERDGKKIDNCAKFAPREGHKYQAFARAIAKEMF